MKNLKDILEGLLQGEEATMIDGDDFVKRPEIALNVKCKNINEVADVISKCIGQKIKVKKMSGKWYVDGYSGSPYIDVKGCPGFAIEHIDDSTDITGRIDSKLYFAVWKEQLVCKYELFYYRRKPGGKSGNIAMWTPAEMANPNNYSKVKNTLGVVGSGTKRLLHDCVYRWDEDTLWDWLVNSGYDKFFSK